MKRLSPKSLSTIFAALAFTVPTASHAVEFTGGSLGLSYTEFSQYTYSNRGAVQGSAEVGFGKAFDMQADVSSFDFDQSLAYGSNVTLHAIYNTGPETSIGAFYGQDQLSGSAANFYGIESGSRNGPLGLEGFLEYASQTGSSATIAGFSGQYSFTPKASIGLSVMYGAFTGSLDMARVSITGNYAVTPGVKLYAEVGSIGGSYMNTTTSEGYVGLGARFTFGPKHGVTFAKRGVLEFTPGL